MSKTSKKPVDKVVKPEANTEAGKIWEEIKDKQIDIFALPNQVVSQYCKPIAIEPTKLYVIPSAPSVLPALETAVGKKYAVTLSEKFLIVARA
jgi:hypothetical protein